MLSAHSEHSISPTLSPTAKELGARAVGFYGLGLVALTLVCYLPALRAGFIWDDDHYVEHNDTLRSLHGLWQIWCEPRSLPQYYPMVHTTFWLEYRLWGLWPAGYHAVNIVLHALTSVALYILLRRLRIPCAWLAAALFAIHPVHVESVAWITERKNVLSGLFYMLSFLAYERFLDCRHAPHFRPRSSTIWAWYFAACFLFVAAMLSKTVACSLPAALLLVQWWKTGRLTWSDLVPTLPFFAIGVSLALVTVHLEADHVGAYGEEFNWTAAERVLIAGRAVWFYAQKLVMPARLTFFYPRWQLDVGDWSQWLYPAGVVCLLLVLWECRRHLGRGPLTAALFFCGTLFPALGFINVYPMRYSFVADHFQYLASIGPIVLFAAAASRLGSWLEVKGGAQAAPYLRTAMATAACLLLAALGAQTWRQSHVYRDLETLWRDTIAKNPASDGALNNLGVLLAARGNINEAVSCFEDAIRLYPRNGEARINLAMARTERQVQAGRLSDALAELEQVESGVRGGYPGLYRVYNVHAGILLMTGKRQRAEEYYRASLRLLPDDNPDAEISLGTLRGEDLAAQGHFSKAVGCYDALIEKYPAHPLTAFAYGNKGVLLMSEGRTLEAIAHLRQSAELNPRPGAFVQLAAALADTGRLDEAALALRAAIALDPNHRDALQMLEALGARPGG
ncbi:MAG: tetratricopeptide repeat protein [Planctomycetota bacterium]